MTELLFYHLQGQKLEGVLTNLLERSLERGWRVVDDKTSWAHLDIAGTGFDSRQTDINRSWGSGWGVRLLDRLVAEFYEG